MSVANTIAEQIGGTAFYLMGARNLSAGTDGLSLTFKVMRGARGTGGQVTHVRVKLDEGADLYEVTSLRCNVRAKEMVKELEVREHIGWEELRATISDLTGLVLKMPIMRAAL